LRITDFGFRIAIDAGVSIRSKRCTADEAVRAIRSGTSVYIHPGCAEPEQLVRAMVRRAAELGDVTVIHLLTAGYADYVLPRH